jgi:Fe(3+) dicitrate transport protein
VSVFRLQYNNRLGSVSLQEGSTFYILRTNVGNTVTHGLEAFAEYSFQLSDKVRCNVFTSTALFDAKYENASIRSGDKNIDVSGNKVESVPNVISRNGLSLKYHKFSISALYSYTAETFADPQNTVAASATGAVGLVPAYGLLDVNASYRFLPNMALRLSANNITDEQYFTKRPTFYPGPGIWPSDGRSMVLTLSVKL